MEDVAELAFDEDAITDREALDASPRFIAFQVGGRLTFRLATSADSGELISKDELLHFVSEQLERDVLVQVGNS